MLENAIRNSSRSGTSPAPILGTSEWLDTLFIRRFQWTGIAAGNANDCNKSPMICKTGLRGGFCFGRALGFCRHLAMEFVSVIL
jgi:hypothetical protein